MIAFLKIIVGCCLFLMLPGLLLERILLKHNKTSLLENIPTYFCLSLTMILPIGVLGSVMKISVDLFYLLQSTLIACFLLLFTIIIFTKRDKRLPNIDINKHILTMLIIAVIYSLTLARLGGSLIIDFLDMMPANKMILNGRIDHSFIMVKDNLQNVMFAYRVSDLMLVILNKFTHLSIEELWWLLPSFMMPVALLAYYRLARSLFDNRTIALLVCLVVVYHFGGIGYPFIAFRKFQLPAAIASHIFMPTLWFHSFAFLRKPKFTQCFMVMLISITLSSFHAYYFLLYLGGLASCLLFWLLLKRREISAIRKISVLITASIITCLPIFILKTYNHGLHNPAYLDIKRLSNISFFPGMLTFIGKIPVIHPEYVFTQVYTLFEEPPLIFPYTPLVAVLLSLLLIKRKEDWAVFLAALSLTPPLVMLNPLIVPVLSRFISLMYVARISELIPTFLILGFFLHRAPGYIQTLTNKFKLPKKHQNAITYIVMILILAYPTVQTCRGTGYVARELSLARPMKECVKMPPPVEYFNSNNIKGCVIISDIMTSCYVGGFTDNFIVGIQPEMTSAELADAVERADASSQIMDANCPNNIVLDILEQYEVNYIVLNPFYYDPQPYKKRGEIHTQEQFFRYLFHNNPPQPGLAEKFKKMGFEKIFDHEGYIIFKVR